MKDIKINESITIRESESFKIYLKEVATIELFKTQEGEIECAIKAKNGDDKAIDELVKRNLRFVISVAKQYMQHNVTLEDLVNQGNIGLIEAAHRFEPDSNNKFITYAVWYIRRQIINYLSKHSRQVKIPTNMAGKLYKFRKLVEGIESKSEVKLDSSQLKFNDKLKENFSVEEIERLSTINDMSIFSMDSVIGNDEDGVTFHDIIESDMFDSTDSLASKQTENNELSGLLSCLSDKESLILKLYYGVGCENPMTLKEISNKIGVSRESVRQIKDKAIRKVRHKSMVK